MTKSRTHINHFLGAVCIIAAPFLLVYFSPNLESQRSLCPFMRWLGLPCPGCGLTKSLYCYAKGDVITSLSYHPFGIVVQGIALCILILSIFDYKKNRTYVSILLDSNTLWRCFAFLFFVFYITRLLSYFFLGDYWF